jgi:YHYH protein
MTLGMAWVFIGALTITASGDAGAATSAKISDGKLKVTSAQSERTAVEAVRWTTNVSVHVSGGSWSFTSDGVPATQFTAAHYAVPANPLAVSAVGASVVATSQVLQDQNYSLTLPITPRYSSKTSSAGLGPIGIMLDGAVLYNPYEANRLTVATHDNFSVTANGTTASFLDSCDGHPGPGGMYHYHGLPNCLVQYATTGTNAQTISVSSLSGTTTPPVVETNAAARKPVVLGFALDGYGIYDNIAMNGRTISVSSLDACNGIFSAVPGYPRGIYHYVLENVRTDRSSLNCFHGVVSSHLAMQMQGPKGSTPGRPPPP